MWEERTGFVAQTLNRDLAGPREVYAQHLALELVEVHVVDGVLRVRSRGKGHEAEALVSLLCAGLLSMCSRVMGSNETYQSAG